MLNVIDDQPVIKFDAPFPNTGARVAHSHTLRL
jgi:hypothetical protein